MASFFSVFRHFYFPLPAVLLSLHSPAFCYIMLPWAQPKSVSVEVRTPFPRMCELCACRKVCSR